jgi:hypothetical protein
MFNMELLLCGAMEPTMMGEAEVLLLCLDGPEEEEVFVVTVPEEWVLLFSELSVSALIRRQVLAPKAFAKWSSTEPVKTSLDGSCWDLIAFHVESPRAFAKWSSTEPAQHKKMRM